MFTEQLLLVVAPPPDIFIVFWPVIVNVCSILLHPEYVIFDSLTVQNLLGKSLLANTKNMYLPCYNPGKELGLTWFLLILTVFTWLFVGFEIDGDEDTEFVLVSTLTVFLSS